MRARRISTRLMLACVLVLCVVGVANALATRHAPPISLLPVPAGGSVVAAADGPSDVDSAYDHKRYRYFAIQGGVDESPKILLSRELAALHAAGWRHQIAFACPQAHPNCIRVKATAPGANILIDAPHGAFYIALDPVVVTRMAAVQQEDGTPLWNNQAIARAIRQKRPLLFGFISVGHRPSV